MRTVSGVNSGSTADPEEAMVVAPSGEGAVDVTVDDLVTRARALLARPDRTVVGIVGPPGAGKSTVTNALYDALGEALVIVPMDGFHLANEVLVALGRRERKGAPDTFDVAGYVALLRRIRDGETLVYAPRFDRELEESIGSALAVPAATRLVLTEGNYLLHDADGWPAVRPLLDEVWYLDVDIAEVRRRLVARRIGHGHAPAAAQDWVTTVDEPNARIVAAGRDRADLVVRLASAAPVTPDPSAHDPKELR